MKIAAILILYHPDESAVSNIKSYYDFVEKIFVFDNTETAPSIKETLSPLEKIAYHHDFENAGIAKRLNEGCEKALYEGFDWVLTMDQDTSFSHEAISNYFACFTQQKDKEKVAAIGTKYSWEVESINATCQPKEVEELITSGMLLNVALSTKIGGFDEALFIDCVDNDYCIRAIVAGYSVLQFTNISILHRLGKQVNSTSIKTLFLIKKKKIIHSPLRCYYMYRNMLYLEKKFEEINKKFAMDTRRHTLARIKKYMLYGREARKIKEYIKLAKVDFENNKMGKIEQEL